MKLKTVFYTFVGAPLASLAIYTGLAAAEADTAGRSNEEVMPPPPAGQAPWQARGEHPRARHTHPVLKVLDADGDRTLSVTEINAAPAVLMQLDYDGNGVVSESELFSGLPPPDGPPDMKSRRGGPDRMGGLSWPGERFRVGPPNGAEHHGRPPGPPDARE